MANKYSKPSKKIDEKQEEHRKGFNAGARVMAIVMIGVMLIFTVISAGLFLLD